MKKYRIKQEGYWFYPQKKTWYGGWVDMVENRIGTGQYLSRVVYFDAHRDAANWLDNYLKPEPPPPKVTIHPYP